MLSSVCPAIRKSEVVLAMGGNDVHDRSNSRTLNRIFITAAVVTFLVALVVVPLYFYLKANRSVQSPCHENLSVPLSSPVFHPDGSVVDGDDVYPSGYHFTANGTTRGCLCVLKPCIRKCCGEDESFIRIPKSNAWCEKNPGPSPFNNFSLPVHTSPGNPVKVNHDHFRILYGDVCQHGKFVLDPEKHPGDRHDLMVDGRFRYIDGDHLDVSKYCLESTNRSEKIRTYVCFQDQTEDDETKTQRWLFPIALMVSMPFLLATCIVYSIIPGLRNLFGKSLVCQCSSLLITYIGLTIIQLNVYPIHNHFWCVFFGFMVQFAFLGSFCWLNVISFDIWWSLSGLRPSRWGLKETEHKRFLLYSLYAWGIPLLIVAASIAMDMIASIPDSFIKPRIGDKNCLFADWQGAFLYLYLPSGTVLGLNAAMFLTTACKLRSHTKNEREKDRFRLYLRLFIIMGLNWILELVSFFVGGPKSVWFITDVSNILQGVVIFFFFVCKREVLQKLNKMVCPSWNLFGRSSPECSKSSSISLAKTEVEVFGLKSLGDINERANEERQPNVA